MTQCTGPARERRPGGCTGAGLRQDVEKLDRLAVRGTPVGLGPGLLAIEERHRIGKALRDDQSLERRQPVSVVLKEEDDLLPFYSLSFLVCR